LQAVFFWPPPSLFLPACFQAVCIILPQTFFTAILPAKPCFSPIAAKSTNNLKILIRCNKLKEQIKFLISPQMQLLEP